MGLEEAQMHRVIMRELSRRPINISRLSIVVTHGVVYCYGQISRVAAHRNADLKAEMEIFRQSLRRKPGIRDVHYEDLLMR
jgi:hypothetical protein